MNQQNAVPTGSGFTSNLLALWRGGFNAAMARRDAVAGLTVAIVALPLSMAIAIASHATPQAGLASAIIGGFIISCFGGNRYQVGGPAGAFIVLVASIIDRHGMDGLLAATMMAGVIMLAAGALRFGALVKHVPHSVIIGFTLGIAIIIFVSQLHDLLGLQLPSAEPGPLLDKFQALWAARSTLNLQAIAIALTTIVLILTIRQKFPRMPALLLAVVVATAIAAGLHLHVETIATRFGAIPSTLPLPTLPDLQWLTLVKLLPDALALAVLGSIESLLSATVADAMTGEKTQTHAELLAQGLANIVAPLCGAITVTGTIARTATNVRANAATAVSGMAHAVYLLLFMAVAAPLIGFIPLAALAGILVVVAFKMVEREHFTKAASWQVLAVIAVTTLLTIFHDLLFGIGAGIILSLTMRVFKKPNP